MNNMRCAVTDCFYNELARCQYAIMAIERHFYGDAAQIAIDENGTCLRKWLPSSTATEQQQQTEKENANGNE